MRIRIALTQCDLLTDIYHSSDLFVYLIDWNHIGARPYLNHQCSPLQWNTEKQTWSAERYLDPNIQI